MPNKKIESEQPAQFDKEHYQKDILDILRKVVEGIQVSEIVGLDNLEGQERIDFLTYCSVVVSNPWFEKVFQALYWPHILAAATKAENYDIVTFHRATANGVSLAKEYFEKMNRRYHEEVEGDKQGFNPTEPFEKTDADKFFKM